MSIGSGRRRLRGPIDAEVVTMSKDRTGAVAGAGDLDGLGIFGAWVYFFQHAHTFWAFILAFFQGIFWPAWMVYHVFKVLNA